MAQFSFNIRVWLFCLFLILFSATTAFAQRGHNSKKMSSLDSIHQKAKVDYDSIWAFCPFYHQFHAGVWTPLGTLSQYFNPSPKFGYGVGVMTSKNVKAGLFFNLYPLNRKADIIFADDSILHKANDVAILSFGIMLNRTLAKNRLFHVDLLAGAGFEIMFPGVVLPKKNPNEKDRTISAAAYSLSTGADILVNAIRDQNLGLRILYSYTPYNNDKRLVTNIGSHSISASLIYNFPRRMQAYRSLMSRE